MRLPALFRVPAATRKDVFKLVGPVMLEQLLISSMGVVGMVLASRLGKDAVTPIGMVDALHFLFMLFFTSVASGATVIVAQHYGRGEVASANEVARQAMATSVAIAVALVGILFFTGVPLVDLLYGKQSAEIAAGIPQYLIPSLFSYPALAIVTTGCGVLRGSGDTRTPMSITTLMGLLNMALSALLIYGVDFNLFGLHIYIPRFGVMGAALAILIARIVGAVLISYVLLKGQRVIRVSFKAFRVRMDVQRALFAIGIPVTAESVLFQVGKLITSIIIVSCGTTHVNANIIAGSVFSLICIPGNAFAVAVMPIVGQSVGKCDYPDARERLLFVNWMSSLGLLLTNALMAALAWPLAYLYTTDAEVAAITVQMLYVVAVFMPISWSASFVLPAGLRGAGDTNYSMVTSIIGMWLFRVLLGYILGILCQMGAVGIYLAMCTDWLVRGTLYYIRVRGSRWYGKSAKLAIRLSESEPAE